MKAMTPRLALAGLVLLFAAPLLAQTQGAALGALTACQVERDRLDELPAALRAQNWRRITPPLNVDQARRLAFMALVNVEGVGDLTVETPVAQWQEVWNGAIRWSNEQMLPWVIQRPDYGFLFEDVTGNLLFIQAGETDTTFSITCTLAVSTSAASVPGFLPELRQNPGPYFIDSNFTEVRNRYTSTERLLTELSLRPADFGTVIGTTADVAAILFTSTSWTKEPR
jgi:hypothetical protein